MTKEEKNKMIEDLAGKLDEYAHVYLADLSGLPVRETTEFRRLCHRRQVGVKVVKNTLLKKAMERAKNDYSPFYGTLAGNTALLFANTGSAPAKAISEFRKTGEKPLLKAAFVENTHYLGDEQLMALSALKSKNELIADVIFLLQSPARRVIAALQSGGQTLTGVLKAMAENRIQPAKVNL